MHNPQHLFFAACFAAGKIIRPKIGTRINTDRINAEYNPQANTAKAEQLLFSKPGFLYTALPIFAVWIRLCLKRMQQTNPKTPCTLHTEYSHLAQIDSGFGVTLHHHVYPSPS